jgi:hypothetical protein
VISGSYFLYEVMLYILKIISCIVNVNNFVIISFFSCVIWQPPPKHISEVREIFFVKIMPDKMVPSILTEIKRNLKCVRKSS